MISTAITRATVIILTGLFFLQVISCKSTSLSRMQSKVPSDTIAAENQSDFAISLISRIDFITDKIIKIRDRNADKSTSPNLDAVRIFAKTESLFPYAKAAAIADRKKNREYSRTLAASIRRVLAAWYGYCSKSEWSASLWAYPTACRDYSNEDLIDEISDFGFIAGVVEDIEKQRGLSFQQSVYYESTIIRAANTKTLQNLRELCETTPLTSLQSDIIVEHARSMQKPTLAPARDVDALKGELDSEKRKILAQIVARPLDLLRHVMIDYHTDIQIFRAAQNVNQPHLVDDDALKMYRSGRRSPITQSFYQNVLSPLFAGGVYSGKDAEMLEESRQYWMPKVPVCAALKYKDYYAKEMRRFYLAALADIATKTGGEAFNRGFNLHVLSRFFSVPLFEYLEASN
jgi:hypothetical protein